MREDIAGPQGASSRPMWEGLEGVVREKAQEFIQQIMEEEVTELLGREKSERSSFLARCTAMVWASRRTLEKPDTGFGYPPTRGGLEHSSALDRCTSVGTAFQKTMRKPCVGFG